MFTSSALTAAEISQPALAGSELATDLVVSRKVEHSGFIFLCDPLAVGRIRPIPLSAEPGPMVLTCRVVHPWGREIGNRKAREPRHDPSISSPASASGANLSAGSGPRTHSRRSTRRRIVLTDAEKVRLTARKVEDQA